MPADPAEAERRRRLVLLARDRLDGTARRLGDLRAPPEDERDRGGGERPELELARDRGQAEVDDEDGDEDRQAAEDLDVEPDQRPQRPELDREQRAEHDPDQRAADDGDRRDPERPRQALLEDVARRPARPSRDIISAPSGERQPALEQPDQRRQRPDERQVDDREHRERLERLERQVGDVDRRRRQLRVADHVHQRRVLDDRDVRVDRRRQRDPAADRQRHVEEGREAAEAEREGGLPVARRHGLEAGAEVLGVERAAPDRHREPGDGEGVEPDPDPAAARRRGRRSGRGSACSG